MGYSVDNNLLHKAKKAGDDEFYTQRKDVEKILEEYSDVLKGKSLFLPCDEIYKSEFFNVIKENINYYGDIYVGWYGSDCVYHYSQVTKKWREYNYGHNGNFLDPRLTPIYKTVDIVITNPPFTLFKEFVGMLINLDVKFITIGNIMSITYNIGKSNMVNLLRDEIVYLNNNRNHSIKWFVRPDGSRKDVETFVYSSFERDEGHYKPIVWSEKPKDYIDLYLNDGTLNLNDSSHIKYYGDYQGEIAVPVSMLMSSHFTRTLWRIVGIADKPAIGDKKLFKRIKIIRR